MVEVAAPNDGTPTPRTLEEPEEEERRAMHPEVSSPDARDVDPSCCVQVAVRVRPLLALEGDDENCVQVLKSYSGNGHATAIQVGGPAGPQFTFDQVFSMASDQIQVYQSRVAPLITSCLDGYNATILAYGQTGSGKTHTIMGPNPTTAVSPNDVDAGVIPRALTAIFAKLEEKKTQHAKEGHGFEYQVSVQFLELYGEEIRDLLTSTFRNDKLTIRDSIGTDEPEVVGATQSAVTSAAQALQHLSHGMLRRVTGATAMNESSSRSHAIFAVGIEQVVSFHSAGEPSPEEEEDQIQVLRSKFNFVDLAGAERQKRTGASGKRLKEGIDINKGLSNLGNVISALGDPRKRGRTHVPYRDAKLTRLLKGSLGGNHKTLMIACVSPAAVNMGESLNCLRYANRAKNIQNKAVVNVDANTRLVQELQSQVMALASDLLKAVDGDTSQVQFSRESLVTLSVGSAFGPSSMAMSPPPKPSRSANGNFIIRLKETEKELISTQTLLRQSQKYHDDAELELFTVRAQNNVFHAQISALTNTDGSGEMQVPSSIEEAFMARAVDYEKEIARLQEQVRTAEAASMNHRVLSENPLFEQGNLDDYVSFIQSEEQALDKSRNLLLKLRSPSTPESAEISRPNASSEPFSDEIGLEAVVGRDHPQNLTCTYLPLDDIDEGSFTHDCSVDESSDVKVQQFCVDIEELSRSIETKERLIQQIKRDKEREMAMRNFFEIRLAELQRALEEKEEERDQLRRQLELAEKRSEASEELSNLLQQKQEQINSMKKLQANYRRQTGESANCKRSEEVDRLKQLENDVKSMKKRKADLQKELALEKRHHLKEVGKLNKMVSQKDREINKIQKISNQRAIEVEKTKTISKSRLEELSQLKKALRLYKRDVGLDPVLVGRRQVRINRERENEQKVDVEDELLPIQVADSIRDYFDSKVSVVVQKEALVDRLAVEWEEYFDLITRHRDEAVSRDLKDELEIQIQFKNDKIRKIAKRLQRPELSSGGSNETSQSNDHFIFDDDFTKLFKEYNPETSRSLGCRVLFGMIVRERRRVAALARTASLLDERVQAAEKALGVNEAALRSYMEEHRQEIADLEQRQHDQIVCLIEMVKEGSNILDFNTNTNADSAFALFQKELLVLANERVSVLEGQLSELRSLRATIQEYELKVNNLNDIVLNKGNACEMLEQESHDLRTSLRQIRDEALKYVVLPCDDSGLAQSIIEMVDSFLHKCTKIPIARNEPFDHWHGGNRMIVSPRFKKHIELMHSSDSESGDEDDDDSSDQMALSTKLMADLSLFVEGKTHQSLCSLDVFEGSPTHDDASVFDRLANPKSFTGTQKHIRMVKSISEDEHDVSSDQQTIERKPVLQDIATRRGNNPTSLDFVSLTATKVCSSSELALEASKHAYQSVFDKLGSPSQYTGTHKDRFQDGKVRRDRSSDENVVKSLSKKVPDEAAADGSVSENLDKVQGDYTKQDVFDRLQKTTTQAAAIRQSETLQGAGCSNDSTHAFADSAHSRSQHDENRSSSPSKEKSEDFAMKGFGEMRTGLDLEAYTKQNVFDRLQKTTTLAVAVRQSETLHLEGRSVVDTKAVISPVSALTEPSSSRKVNTRKTGSKVMKNTVSSVDPKPDVFERLNKTTTRAYAKKSSRQNIES